MNEAAVRQCRWREPGGIDAALQIAAFLDGIGIELEAARVDGSVLPGMTTVSTRPRAT